MFAMKETLQDCHGFCMNKKQFIKYVKVTTKHEASTTRRCHNV